MIHKIKPEYFDLDLQNWTLTFDDGYKCHYQHWPSLRSIPTHKIFFIVPAWIGQTGFLTLDQVKYLSGQEDVTIGAHSFGHFMSPPRLVDLSTQDKMSCLTRDTEHMIRWFESNLGYVPRAFCFPFNNDWNGLYQQILTSYGFTQFYGIERTDIDHLCES